jgi:hypothetical protein
MSTVTGLVQSSSFVFVGTVTSPGKSAVEVLEPNPGLAVVRFDRGFIVNPVLGQLTGRPITVRLAQGGAGTGAVRPGQKFIFFTTAWVHGKEIAVAEVSRLPADDKTEQEVARAVAALPELHLSERIASAALIVDGAVTEIERAADVPGTASEHDPAWMRASIEVREVLKGGSSPAGGGKRASSAKRAHASLLFPGSGDIAFRSMPRVSVGQKAVFLLHRGAGRVPQADLIAPDPADVQSVEALPTIRRLIGGSTAPPQ